MMIRVDLMRKISFYYEIPTLFLSRCVMWPRGYLSHPRSVCVWWSDTPACLCVQCRLWGWWCSVHTTRWDLFLHYIKGVFICVVFETLMLTREINDYVRKKQLIWIPAINAFVLFLLGFHVKYTQRYLFWSAYLSPSWEQILDHGFAVHTIQFESLFPPDECSSVVDCDINAQCLYDSSSQRYRCVCNAGYEGDGHICTTSRG